MQLYSRIRLLDGWSEPEPLMSLNEQGNVNYPFLMSDGITLYYASDGEGSLGGYDIFELAMIRKMAIIFVPLI